jgi:hypothetical protein
VALLLKAVKEKLFTQLVTDVGAVPPKGQPDTGYK